MKLNATSLVVKLFYTDGIVFYINRLFMINNIVLWFKRNKIQVWIWTLFIFYENVVVVVLFGIYAHPFIYIFHYIIIISFFYVHAHYLMPRVTRNKRNIFWKACLIMIVQIPIYVLMHYLVNYLLAYINIIPFASVKLDKDFIIRNCHRGTYFIGFSTGYYFLKNYFNERKKTEELERERLNNIINRQSIEQELVLAQNAYLKAQINPHFLFNTLDFVYHNVNMHSEVAGETIIRLAEMMRFAIDSDQMEGKIMLSEEIQQVNNLIFLNQVRKNNQLNVKFYFTDSINQIKIIPLIVLTLVENIFKHADLTNSSSPANISVDMNQEKLEISTSNLMNHSEFKSNHQSGINNIQKRLQHAYGDEAKLYCFINQHHFLVTITIPLKLLK
jgi:two-component system LytT family sensor kinase